MAPKKKAGATSSGRNNAPEPAEVRHETRPADPKSNPPIVAIGVSGRALSACTALLSAIPEGTGLAALVIVAGELDSKAWLEGLRGAAHMPVSIAKEGEQLLVGRVYLVPADAQLILDGGRFVVSGASQHPIDALMRALAADRRGASVGVVLAGDKPGGVLGLEAIKAEGGFTFAQSDAPGDLSAMPRNALSSGCVDFSLSPAAIGAELVSLSEALGRAPGVTEQTSPELDSDLQQIFKLVRQARGVDFTLYRHSTVRRRISRRMLLHRANSLREYTTFLREHPEEVDALFHDMLIRVTSFFRDPKAFELLKERVFPELFAEHSIDRPVRIWVPGCATGEEAYSMAIAALEYALDIGTRVALQIFATDVSEPSIERARSGIYPENIALDVSEERLARFFVRTERGYQIDKIIRDMCVFARQNVTSDPPFSRLDLISCRNLLIYLEPALQKRVMPIFHYALKPGGYLLLGSAETPGSGSELFTLADKASKLYTKTAVQVTPPLEFGAPLMGSRPSAKSLSQPEEGPPIVDVEREADRAILSRFAPVGVVVNEDYHVVQFRGHTGAYLEPAPGEPSLHVLKMAREGLLVELRSALHRAQTTGDVARSGVLSVRANGGYRDVVVQVIPLPGALRETRAPRHYLVLFEEVSDTSNAPRAQPPPGLHPPDVERLQHELASTREYLQSIIEEQEATNEELQSANEEILSSNEELQSINEELETAKEELQSTNEELTTVNEELHKRNEELLQANNDLHNSLASVNMPIVMLGADLRIRRFTPTAERVLRLIATDIGRPIGDIRPKIDVPDLERRIRDVVATARVQEHEVCDQDGHWYLMRILPYRSTTGRIDGAVLCLVDIDALKRAVDDQVGWRGAGPDVLQRLPMPLLFLDGALRVLSANRAFTESFDVDPATTEGRYIYELGAPWRLPSLRTVLEELLAKDGGQLDYELVHGDGDGKAVAYRLRAVDISKDRQGKLLALWLSPLDQGARRKRRIEATGAD